MQTTSMQGLSKGDQAKEWLDFDALERASPPPQAPDLVFEDLIYTTHTKTIRTVNSLAIQGIFLPLKLASQVLAKFGDERFGSMEHVERFFKLTLEKYCKEDRKNPDIQNLYSELMWVYLGRKDYDNKRIIELKEECESSGTLSALCCLYNRKKEYERTIDLYTHWPDIHRKIGACYRYYGYALQDTDRRQEARDVYVDARKKHSELMRDDETFFVDYITFVLRSGKNYVTKEELSGIEALFEEFPEKKEQDQSLDALLKACFDAKRDDKAKHFFTPVLQSPWLGPKTCVTILSGMAEVSLPQALELYQQLGNTKVKKGNPTQIKINLHKNSFTSFGKQEYGADSNLIIELKMWHLYKKVFAPKSLGNKENVRVTIIPGKGTNHVLKKKVINFLVNTFGWPKNTIKDEGKNTGAIVITATVGDLLFHRTPLPKSLSQERALENVKK